MDVVIDGRSNFEIEGDPDHLMAVVAAVTKYLRDEGRGIIKLTVDGRDVPHTAGPEDLTDWPTQEVRTVEVETAPIAAMVEAALAELEATLPELPLACRDLARIFHSERPDEGYGPFQQLAEIWGQVKERQSEIVSALGADPDALAADGKPLLAHHQELNEFLSEAADALAAQDTVLIGDLLEYELAPRAESELAIVAALRQYAAEKRG